MENNNFKIYILPDIEMYGGDTTPWIVTPTRDDGRIYSEDYMVECTAILTLTPFKASTGQSNNSVPMNPVLIKEGELNVDSFIFSFDEDDTIFLRGKFVYQIEIRHNEDLRLSQGCLYIKQNINR